jgi:hypothetical protein
LTVDYFLAEVLQRSSSFDREGLLRRATAEYEKYLTRIDEYELLSSSDKKTFEQFLENPSAFSLASKNDAANRREVKVARFRQEKELKQKLEVWSFPANMSIAEPCILRSRSSTFRKTNPAFRMTTMSCESYIWPK